MGYTQETESSWGMTRGKKQRRHPTSHTTSKESQSLEAASVQFHSMTASTPLSRMWRWMMFWFGLKRKVGEPELISDWLKYFRRSVAEDFYMKQDKAVYIFFSLDLTAGLDDSSERSNKSNQRNYFNILLCWNYVFDLINSSVLCFYVLWQISCPI